MLNVIAICDFEVRDLRACENRIIGVDFSFALIAFVCERSSWWKEVNGDSSNVNSTMQRYWNDFSLSEWEGVKIAVRCLCCCSACRSSATCRSSISMKNIHIVGATTATTTTKITNAWHFSTLHRTWISILQRNKLVSLQNSPLFFLRWEIVVSVHNEQTTGGFSNTAHRSWKKLRNSYMHGVAIRNHFHGNARAFFSRCRHFVSFVPQNLIQKCH